MAAPEAEPVALDDLCVGEPVRERRPRDSDGLEDALLAALTPGRVSALQGSLTSKARLLLWADLAAELVSDLQPVILDRGLFFVRLDAADVVHRRPVNRLDQSAELRLELRPERLRRLGALAGSLAHRHSAVSLPRTGSRRGRITARE